MKKKILVVSQYYYPEQFRIIDICEEWVKKGYEVTVLTGIPNYPQGKFFPGYGYFKRSRELLNGVRIVRIPIIPRGGNKVLLSLNYISYVISGWFFAAFSKFDANLVFIYEVSPMTQALPGLWFAERKRVPCILYVMDMWPENVSEAIGLKQGLLYRAIDRMVAIIYSKTTRVLASSESMKKAIVERGVDSNKVEYWPQYAEEIYRPILGTKESKNGCRSDDGRFHVVFAGNIGTAQGLWILPNVASSLKAEGFSVVFDLVGDGRAKRDLVDMVSSMGLEDMFNFIPSQPAFRIPEIFAECDAALISLRKNPIFEKTIPAKTQSCLACGIPILVSADGEANRIIKEAKAGYGSPAEDLNGLLENIKKMMKLSIKAREELGNNGYEYFREHFEKSKVMNRMDDILDEIMM